MGIVGEIRLCLGLLTRLPVTVPGGPQPGSLSTACRWFPLVGVLVGTLAAGVLVVASLALLPVPVAALAAIGTAVLLTGALHEDGLADVADGFGGGRDAAQKLDIMRDSAIGAYGALALIVSIGFRWSLVAALLDVGVEFAVLAVVVAAATSRLVPVFLIHSLPPARPDGLGVSVGPSTGWGPVIVATGLTVAVLFVLGDWRLAVAAMAGTLVAAAIIGTLARRQIGGQTGDVLGAGQQVGEILTLLALLTASRWM